jgi:hypothetical protein
MDHAFCGWDKASIHNSLVTPNGGMAAPQWP